MGRGRPKGSIKRRVPTAVINEWSAVYNEGGDSGKAYVLQRIEELELDKTVILARMADAYHRNKDPELAKAAEIEASMLIEKLAGAIKSSKEFQRLSEVAPRDNVIVNLETLEIERKKRPVPRSKR